ncbi:MAG: hypothetical protein ABJN04_11125 [Hyphomicrobiales bacterium]
MIWNIVDRRKKVYRWRKINAVIENIANDNSVQDTDIFDEENEAAPVCDEKKGVLLHEAITWAESKVGKVTLHIYDDGDGI